MAQSYGTDGGGSDSDGDNARVNFIDDQQRIDQLQRLKAECEVAGVKPSGTSMSDIYREAVALEIEHLRNQLDQHD